MKPPQAPSKFFTECSGLLVVALACATSLGLAHVVCPPPLDRGLVADGMRALSAHDWMLTLRLPPSFCRCRGLGVQRVALLSRILRARRYQSLRVARAGMPRHRRSHTHITRHRDTYAPVGPCAVSMRQCGRAAKMIRLARAQRHSR